MSVKALFDLVLGSVITFVGKVGYVGIFAGMFIESTVFPLPSELVMIPAGMAAAAGKINLSLVILYGTLGSVAGAAFNYYLAILLGRPLLFKIGKYFLMNEKNILRIEVFFAKHGAISTFIGRLIPGFRHYISLPAGVARMNIAKFLFYTFLGSFIWVTVLTCTGFLIGSNQELIKEYLNMILIGCFGFSATLIFIYCIIYRRKIAREKIVSRETNV